jgi:hypothetical protein
MPPTTTAPAGDDALPDLHELLAQRGLSHWHALLQDLMSRYAGWVADYLQDPAAEPDYRPLSEVIEAVGTLPQQHTADEVLLHAIMACEFICRAGLDRLGGHIAWDPTAESYAAFVQKHPARFPLWLMHPPDRLQAWLTQQVSCALATQALDALSGRLPGRLPGRST